MLRRVNNRRRLIRIAFWTAYFAVFAVALGLVIRDILVLAGGAH